MSWRTKLRALFRRERLDVEMAEEMRAHLELQTAENIRRGMSAVEARYAARRAFGGVEQIKEQARDQRTWVWLEQALQDVRFAARGLRRSPGFMAVAVLTLALGIGVNTSMFTGLQALLMRELPYPDPDRLVEVFRTSPQSQRWPHSPGNFVEQQARNAVFERMAAFTSHAFNLAEAGRPAERVNGAQVTADFFPLLGVPPALGRGFTADDDRPGANNVVVLAYGFWQRHFAGNPLVLGRTLRLSGETVTVIGVMPEASRDRATIGSAELWRPLGLTKTQRQDRGGNFLHAIARLKPGVSLAQARAAMTVLAAEQARDHPDTNSEIGLRLEPLADAMDPRGRLMLWLAMALAGFVLLIACANLANLQFARTARRTHELALRGALGATRGRLLRQLLVESLLLAALGGLLGLVLARWGVDLLNQQINRSGELALRLNWRVLGFAFGASVLSGFGFGLVPAWLASRANASDAMKQGARGTVGDRARHRIQHALIIAEVALALVLLAGAGLAVHGLQRFTAQDPGWQLAGLTTGSFNLPDRGAGDDVASVAFADRVREKLGALPGVESVALGWGLPIRPFNTAGSFSIAGRPKPPPGLEPIRFVNAVTPGYFTTCQMRLLRGRDFTPADAAGRPAVVIINETMARTFWPGASPLGQRLEGEEVVGVVNDVRFAADPSAPLTPYQTYRPLAQAPRGSLTIAVRGSLPAETLRRAITELDADLPVNDSGLAQARVDQALAGLGGTGWLLSGFGALGLLLASLGLYGVLAGFVAQRTQEIGVRVALGAQVRDVLWLVMGKGLRLTLVGVAIGLGGAIALGRVLAAIAPGFGAGDPVAILLVAAVLTAVAAIACWLPARRATKVDPMVALRAE